MDGQGRPPQPVDGAAVKQAKAERAKQAVAAVKQAVAAIEEAVAAKQAEAEAERAKQEALIPKDLLDAINGDV